MKKFPFIYRVILTYFLVVFVSALINWLHFKENPTSFLLSNQLNNRLERFEFKSPEKGVELYLQNANDSIPLTIEEFYSMSKPFFEELIRIDDSLAIQKVASSLEERVLDSLTSIASQIRSDSISVLSKRVMEPYQRKIDDIKISMEGRDSIELTLAGKYVELAEAQVEYAEKNAEFHALIIKQYAFLLPSSLSNEITELNNQHIEALISLQHLELSRFRVYDRIKALSAKFQNNRVNKVGFKEFFYYSVCVSTTVSFGDIAPNDPFTRAFALLELIGCVVLVGCIVDYFASRRRDAKTHNTKD